MTRQESIRKAVEIYRKFRGHNPSQIIIAPPLKINTAVRLGKMVGVIYESDRERRGKPTRYIHFIDKPYPDLDVDVETKRLFTSGGRIRVTRFGLVG